MLQFISSNLLASVPDLEVVAPTAPVDVEGAVWDAVADAELDED